jgi:peptidoglycan/xylan/chitin deacetylase (PgdA/CDA1 family)
MAAGYRFAPAAEIARGEGGPKALAITFDDGPRSVATVAAPLLAEYKIPWSVFVVSGWSDRQGGRGDDLILGWRDLEGLAAAGADIGSHSVTHPDFSRLDPSRVVDELGESRRMIEKRLGLRPETFAVPFGQSKNWPAHAAKAALEVGYTTVYAQAENTRPAATVPRTFVTHYDNDHVFRALLDGAFDQWEEWF